MHLSQLAAGIERAVRIIVGPDHCQKFRNELDVSFDLHAKGIIYWPDIVPFGIHSCSSPLFDSIRNADRTTLSIRAIVPGLENLVNTFQKDSYIKYI